MLSPLSVTTLHALFSNCFYVSMFPYLLYLFPTLIPSIWSLFLLHPRNPECQFMICFKEGSKWGAGTAEKSGTMIGISCFSYVILHSYKIKSQRLLNGLKIEIFSHTKIILLKYTGVHKLDGGTYFVFLFLVFCVSSYP